MLIDVRRGEVPLEVVVWVGGLLTLGAKLAQVYGGAARERLVDAERALRGALEQLRGVS